MRWEKQIAVMVKASRAAGQEVLKIARNGVSVSLKSNSDPVTAADYEANNVLRELLLGSFPDYGWLSEETKDDLARLDRGRVFVIDPIDGTKEFVMGIPEYALSVALVEHGIPVAAVVYNPATNELFRAVKGQGADLNGAPIRVAPALGARPILLASRSEIERGEWQPFEPHADVRAVGSIAYKLALIASGMGDGTFSLGPKHEWDIAAGVLLVDEAGGSVADLDGYRFVFNRSNTLVNGIIAGSAAAYPMVRTMIAQHGPSGVGRR